MTPYTAQAAVPLGRVQLVHLRYKSLLTARWRVLWIAIIFAAVAGAAILRIAVLGFVGGTADRGSLAEQLLPPRGEITDRNGAPLARAFPAYAMWFDPKAMGDDGAPLVRSPEEIATQLNGIFPDMDVAKTAERLSSGRAGYLRRRVLPEEANKVFELGDRARTIGTILKAVWLRMCSAIWSKAKAGGSAWSRCSMTG